MDQRNPPFSTIDAASVPALYANLAVRRRFVEFLGGDSLDKATARFISGDDTRASLRRPRPASELWNCLDDRMEISRALWDRESLVAHLDLEYVNFDEPGEAFRNPERVLELQRPAQEAVSGLLPEYGIAPMHVLSGRGHHFIWTVPAGSTAFENLAGLGGGAPSLRCINANPHPPDGEPVPEAFGAAFHGLGLVMEYLAHRIQEAAAPQSALPVELTAVEVGPRFRDREMISLDISEYGDPLHTAPFASPSASITSPLNSVGSPEARARIRRRSSSFPSGGSGLRKRCGLATMSGNS